eukprot:760400-Hanusia_phi.AAC.9
MRKKGREGDWRAWIESMLEGGPRGRDEKRREGGGEGKEGKLRGSKALAACSMAHWGTRGQQKA